MKEAIDKANRSIALSKHSKMAESDLMSSRSRMKEVEESEPVVDARSQSNSKLSLASISQKGKCDLKEASNRRLSR